MQFDSVDEILDFAITKEEEAAQFYNELAERMPINMKDVFLGFAKEEQGHKARLEKVKAGGQLIASQKKILDLKIGDHLEDPEVDRKELSYQEALIVAMRAEKAAYKLYNDLANATDDPELQVFFLALAQEEAKHKLRFELEYDDIILFEN